MQFMKIFIIQVEEENNAVQRDPKLEPIIIRGTGNMTV